MAEDIYMGQSHERWTYDVFLSFRGEDVREGFLSHLYNSLGRSGIYAFRDDDELKRGENISPALLKAIETSKILLVVLSNNYASSAWCLDELVHIMKCRESDSGQMVFPVFYNVDPSVIRRQTGSFGESFVKHESRYPESKLQKWRGALTQIGNLSGFHSHSYSKEADVIDHVIREILRKLPSSYLHLPTYGVGIRTRVHRISELLCFGSDDVKVIGICGMGGIGKTTLAKAAYNEFSQRFEGTSFLENFGEYSTKPEGKVHLQRKLLSDILKTHGKVFNNMDHEVRQRFRNKKVFVVLDDVKDINQIYSTSINLACFGPGSRIIITCRNRHLLEQLGVEDINSPEELDGYESLELLSWHAFRRSEPPAAFAQLSDKLVKYCQGLPLAVEVLGALLFNRNTSQWRSTLKLLKQTPNANIQANLKISFDALDPEQKEIFLDISCFFIGMDKHYVGYILDGCNFYPDIGLAVLKERCLITVRDNRLVMHDLLRDMGRNIVREAYRSSPENWSRLWDRAHVIEVLANNSGTGAIEGLSLKAEVTGVENLEVDAFSNLRKLRLLQLSHVHVNGNYSHFPRGLRWLCWSEFPHYFIPTELHLGSLVVMDLQYSNLERLWDDQKQPQELKKLKYLDLSHSIQLTETPDFSYLPNLETLLLINCNGLVLVHRSIGTLQSTLALINLRGCTKLSDLPLELYTLKSLETLIISGCSQLEILDDALGELESLTTLKADSTAIRQIPSSKTLKELSLDGCKELWKDRDYTHSDESPQAALSVPPLLNGLSCLKTLRLGSCNLSDESVPANLGSLPCLEELDLQGNNFRNLQTDFAGLLSLQILRLDSCSQLQSMFSLPKKLRSFYASNCSRLERTPDLSECSVLQSLHLTNCYNLVDTPGLDKLKTVGLIHMEMCNRISATYRERIMQGWAVGASGGIFIPGSSIPNWVSFKNETHSISFRVPDPETLNHDPVGFTLWTPYVSQQDNEMSGYSPKITVKNQTKGTVWRRNPATDHIRMYREKHIWQGHFSNEEFLLETGDNVEVSVDFGDQVTILETGLSLAYSYREQNPDASDEDTSNIGYEVIPNELLTRTEEEVDDEVITEGSQSRPRRKKRVGLKKLMRLFCLLAFVMFL